MLVYLYKVHLFHLNRYRLDSFYSLHKTSSKQTTCFHTLFIDVYKLKFDGFEVLIEVLKIETNLGSTHSENGQHI